MYKVIFRNGTEPSTIETNGLIVSEGETQNVVVKTSGVPNVPLSKIYANIFGGEVFAIGKLRIECISGTADVTEPISYRLQTSEGDMAENPIYPNISVIQHVDSVIDVDLEGLMLNADSFFKITTIPPNTKIRYSFYPKEQGSPSITFKHTQLDKELIIPDLNKIDGISQEKVLDIQSPKTDTENPSETQTGFVGGSSVEEKSKRQGEENKKCGWWWIIAVGIGIFATYKMTKKK